MRPYALGAAPAPLLLLTGMVSLQFGSAFAKRLFEETGPTGATLLRLLVAAALLCLLSRPAPRLLRVHWRLLLPYGAVFAVMQFAFYEATSRRALDRLWVAVAAVGRLVLGGTRGMDDPVGLAASLLTGTAPTRPAPIRSPCPTPPTTSDSVMPANNEISTIQPVAEIGAVTRAAGVPLHCDATQGVGSLPVDVRALGVDLLTFSGHKIYGPKGVGVLYVSNRLSDRAPLAPLLHGGGQERGLRAGTVDTAAVIGLGAAVGVLTTGREEEAVRLAALRERFLSTLAEPVPYALNSGTGPGFLPHAVNLSFEGTDAQQLLLEVTDIAVSTGSACNSAAQEPSHVLTATGLTPERIRGSIRVGFGCFTTEEDVVHAARALAAGVSRPAVGAA
ncbi:aminotransferase class V-fold PLP-dependent enzyme [Streptomyces sp. NPDC006482]|uniref:aminotransferase class V-fold PLP-dependent enzyme n=1 Tax=Streptomyces sp. NPDC006482 TaxID=3154306 RepID=UPI0033A2F305